jgi:DNA mismatch endonuclease (patch repair protein)
MADRLTPAQRSKNMSAIRSKNTAPEKLVRSMAHAAGYRFRLHRPDLPGSPDIVFPRRRAVVFVHGCYWHGHGCKRGGTGSKSNTTYWGPKIERTRNRDEANRRKLEQSGWRVLTVWECELSDVENFRARLISFLEAPAPRSQGGFLHPHCSASPARVS